MAYEAIVEANRLSQWEVRQSPQNTEITARGERIKYVQGQLRGKIVLMRVTLPRGAPASERIVTVQREGRDARDVGGAIAVAPIPSPSPSPIPSPSPSSKRVPKHQPPTKAVTPTIDPYADPPPAPAPAPAKGACRPDDPTCSL